MEIKQKTAISNNQNFLENVQDINFWKSLCPELSITQLSPLNNDSFHYLNQEQWTLCNENLNYDGYFLYHRFLHQRLLDPLNICFQRLIDHDIPPVFAFVYDEFWQVLNQLKPICQAVFGDGYYILPDFYAWHVTAENQSGFAPHRDHVVDNFINKDGSPNYLTLWVPLLDVSTRQSCIHVMPASLDNHYPNNLYDINIDKAEKIRALPAEAGSVLAWNVGVMHWGSVASPFAPPRDSIAFCVQSKSQTLLSEPVIDFDQPLPFLLRLGLIGRQILDYSRDRHVSLVSFAKELQSHLKLDWDGNN